MQVVVEGADGVLGRRLLARAPAHPALQVRPVADAAVADVLVRATPARAWEVGDVPSLAPAVRQRDAPLVDVGVCGFWGGLGALLAGAALEEARRPLACHVAYGLPGARGVLARSSATVRRALLRLATDESLARVDGDAAPEPLGEGRRLAWFPAPVGPAHAVAVGGLEQMVSLDVPTVRTWLAAGSTAAELLQALGRLDVERGLGAWLDRRAGSPGHRAGATEDLRWAVVVEVREEDGGIVRSWANGTDPLQATADLLLLSAGRLGALGGVPTDVGSTLDLGAPRSLLDALADLRTLRWSVSRPEPARR